MGRGRMNLVTSSVGELIAEGRAALRAGDAGGARRAFEAAQVESSGGDVIEGLARASYLELNFAEAIEGWERAYAAFRDAGDHVGVVRVARTVSYMYLAIVGDWAVGSGWLARAQTLLGEAGESPERGWVALNIGMFEADRVRKEEHFREALSVARTAGDTDLEFVALSYLGASLVHSDRTEEGMMLLDEALAAVAGSDVEDFCVLEEIFCQLFSACEYAHDVSRADQWIRIGEAIAERRQLPAVSAFCRTHYGAVLTAAGRWPEAEAALTAAARLWGLGQKSLRGGALVRLADLRVRQGRYEDAEQLLDGLDAATDPEVARPLAALHLANGQTALARDVLERALAQIDRTSTSAAPLLALLVDVHLSADMLDDAASAADELTACAALHSSHYLIAVAALARGRVCLAAGSGDAQGCLREALAGFGRAQMPMEVAHSRLELAQVLLTEHPEIAMSEARAALEAFDRLQAARHADEAAAVLRLLGVRTGSAKSSGGLLSKRETEVLDLIGHGLSNPEISERLFISRKTVEHHVGNILSKLGLRTRGQAAAYTARPRTGKPGDQ
jgi:ATP/maltotriose-dependent transcriptional regulator MalT